jgi:Negative regulator of sigma F
MAGVNSIERSIDLRARRGLDPSKASGVAGSARLGLPGNCGRNRHRADAQSCLAFILCISIPLSILLIAMLRRACSLRPNLAAAIGGLACASAAATKAINKEPLNLRT